MASVEMGDGGRNHDVELVVSDATALTVAEEITPLLTQGEKPKINIFSVSYPRRRPREQVIRVPETEVSVFTQFILWTWSGSKYSGLLCMALSSTIYFVMEVLSDIFLVPSIPLFETVFTRCTIILILSFLWLRRTGQPLFGPTHVRNLLVSRAIMGYLSLLSFIYSIQSLPLSQAILLNFTTPIMASIAARIVLQEKLKIADIGELPIQSQEITALLFLIHLSGLACSFFGVLFIFRSILTTQGRLTETGERSNRYVVRGSHPIYAILFGLFSSVTGGISYCFVRAGAKASDQPVITVFSFGLLASPAAAICTFAFQDFLLPDLYSFLLTSVLGVLAFFAEVLLARGLQLEKTSKVANIQYIEAFLSQIWGIGLSRILPSFGRLVGCFLILVSVCCTAYFGPEKEME
ncbi:hypothetical protein HHK36_003315 [Tetracentron sinense]|uniref:EamA domain-containing protein n=1 Tax=Tetracentron sinense TaxID=13715 RepID=A0A835DNU1_TETSI|nr:hypothetical protein HHK36_003315 [Tetracentron sinense]